MFFEDRIMVSKLGRVALGLTLLVAAVAPFVGCKPRDTAGRRGDRDTVRVGVSFPGLYCFAVGVVGKTGDVFSLKSTQGAHGSELTGKERERAEAVDVLFINGLGLDDTFAKKVKDTSGNRELKVVALGDLFKHDLLLESDGCECKHEDGSKHDHGDHDPHVWLGTPQAVRMVELMSRELCELYPKHADTFKKNAAAYTEKLLALQAYGKEKLPAAGKAERKIVTLHGSMNYFAKSFDVTVAGVVQTTPGKEPSKKETDELIKVCLKEKVRVIAAEPQYSTHGAVKVLKEALTRGGIADHAVIELDPLETAADAELKPDWYESKMKANIDSAARAFAK